MSKIYFFTKESSIETDQLAELAFGQQPEVGSVEKYNLDNNFSVSEDAPAYAITKSLVFAMPSNANYSLLNIALLPLNTYVSGFPVKMFIYRGIKKSSLVDSLQNIPESDGTWDSSNILKVIKEVQDKLNSKNGTNLIAKPDCLGLNFSELPDTTFIEKIFFDDTDSFHPLIVEAGCQIGKFTGGSTLAGIEVVLDMIGYEPTLKLLKASNHTLEIDKLTINENLTDVEKLKLKFNNRFKKEEILNYVDITAFYGATKNQGLRIKGADSGENFLKKFYNKNTVYIDIRDDWGFSYNHFFKFKDELRVGFYSADSAVKDPVYTDMNYYTDWPILKITNQIYNNSKKWFHIKIPIYIGSPINANFLSSYVGKISTEIDTTQKKHFIIADGDGSNKILLKESEAVKLKNWKYNDNKLGSNYILLKKSTKGDTNNTQNISSIWNNFFSLKMNNIFGFNDLIDGDFRIYTYSSINFPLIIDSKKGEAYLPTAGIAIDKNHVTFFSYKDEVAFKSVSNKADNPVAIIGKGKFNIKFNTADYDYENTTNPHTGFLNQIVKTSKIGNFELTKFSISDTENTSDTVKFLTYSKTGDTSINDAIFKTFESITLTHNEYNSLKAYQLSVNSDFPNQPLFIKCKKYTSKAYQTFTLEEYTLTLGIPTFVDNKNSDLNFMTIADSLEEITYDDLPITLTSIN
ncbi:hypothetical protein [Flavobacterium chilense]|uniref:Uncharacterized protein n=1 Tax=Flavobacterium chilense TaxID=946677 RepID=A0A1M7ERV1_9FLAO|nr:hypothetical protein [Flavobacterium chilense]SHL94440.1 hypothetical protein SAMN05444484_10347 [Flavobacterium chilense]